MNNNHDKELTNLQIVLHNEMEKAERLQKEALNRSKVKQGLIMTVGAIIGYIAGSVVVGLLAGAVLISCRLLGGY